MKLARLRRPALMHHIVSGNLSTIPKDTVVQLIDESPMWIARGVRYEMRIPGHISAIPDDIVDTLLEFLDATDMEETCNTETLPHDVSAY